MRVIYVKTGVLPLRDIQVDVLPGVVTVIPAELALRSKDLYRAIGQRLLMQVHPGAIHEPLPRPMPPIPEPPAPLPGLTPSVREHVLEEEVRLLRDALERREQLLLSVLVAQQGRLEALGTALQGLGQGVARAPTTGFSAPAALPPSDVMGDAPLFIPSTIKPQDVEGSVSIRANTQEGAGISAATEALRKARRERPQ